MNLPKDPIIFISYINTQLRDCYNSLDDLAAAYCTTADEIIVKAASVGYEYRADLNQFK